MPAEWCLVFFSLGIAMSRWEVNNVGRVLSLRYDNAIAEIVSIAELMIADEREEIILGVNGLTYLLSLGE